MSVPSALPMQTRLAELGEVNVEARTIDVVWTKPGVFSEMVERLTKPMAP